LFFSGETIMNTTIETKLTDRVQNFVTTVLKAGQKCIEATKDPSQSGEAVISFVRSANEAMDKFLYNMPASFKEATLKEVLKTVFARIPGQVLMKLLASVGLAVRALYEQQHFTRLTPLESADA
jgi:hypothetical protein